MHRRWSRIFALTMGIPLMLAFLAACGAGTSTTQGTQSTVTIEIGTDFPTSQGDATAGKPAENGARYAIDQANSSNFLPNYKFVIKAMDDVGANGTHDPVKGQNNVNALIGDAEVAAIIGPLNSSVAQSEMPVANRADIALISPANSNDCLTQDTPAAECGGSNSRLASLRPTGKVTYFRTSTRDVNQGKAEAEFAYKEKHFTKAYVIDDTETYGAGLAANFINFFQGFGGTIIDHKSIASTSSYEDTLTAAAAAKPDLIFFGGNDSTGGTTIRQQMATIPGLQNTPFEAGDGLNTPAFSKAIAPLKGGPVYDTLLGLDPTTSAQWNTFSTGYQKAYGQLGSYTAGTYDDAEIVLNAIKTVINSKNIQPPKNPNDTAASKTFRDAVVSAIQSTNYSGLTGKQTFDSNGDTTNLSISMYTVGDPNVGTGWKFLEGVNPNG
jgi:branched-chain amino acid transport system substrate-binding protein